MSRRSKTKSVNDCIFPLSNSNSIVTSVHNGQELQCFMENVKELFSNKYRDHSILAYLLMRRMFSFVTLSEFCVTLLLI